MTNKKTAFLIARITQEEKQSIIDKALKEGCNVSALVRKMIEFFLANSK